MSFFFIIGSLRFLGFDLVLGYLFVILLLFLKFVKLFILLLSVKLCFFKVEVKFLVGIFFF